MMERPDALDGGVKPNRFFTLRHKQGFGDHELETVEKNWRDWRRWVDERLAGYREELGWGDAVQYVFFEPRLSEDRTTITVPLGGEPMYPAVGIFEGEVLFQRLVKGLTRDFLAKASVREEQTSGSSELDGQWIPGFSYMESPGVYLRVRSIFDSTMRFIAGPPAFRWLWSAFVLLAAGALVWDTVDALREGVLPPFLQAGGRLNLVFLLVFGFVSFRLASIGWRRHLFLGRKRKAGR